MVVEGEMSPYMEKTEKIPLELPDYYNKLLESAILYLGYTGYRHPESCWNHIRRRNGPRIAIR